MLDWMKKGGRDGFKLSKPNIPSFHYSIIPKGLWGIDHHKEFGFLVAEITKFVDDA